VEAPFANPVLATPAADPERAAAHFSRLLEFETDCWDTHAALAAGGAGIVVLDVRAPELFAAGHVDGAHNLPHRKIVERTLAAFPNDVTFVVYCAGPHCNGADKAALRISRLGRPVKKMIGGVTGWVDEGFELVRD
jgi:rhodanese-related sulfurtransferase